MLVFHSAQGEVSSQLLFLIKFCKLVCVLLCVMPSHILECSRVLRETRVRISPQLVGWGRVGTCGQRCGWSIRKQGAGHSASSRRSWFDGALLGVRMATRRDRIDGRVGTQRVLPWRKQRPRSRALVHETPIATSATTTCTAQNGAWFRAETASDVGWLRRGRSHTKRAARRHERGGGAPRTDNSGWARGTAFVSSNKPSGGRSRRVRGPKVERLEQKA